MTLTELPKFELFEEGSQIRRSVKGVKSTIVEGYGRRDYKQEFIRYLTFAIASNDETLDHLETLRETESLKNEKIFNELHGKIDKLGRMLNLFIKGVEEHHQSKK
jgi:four helix bundle protein